jgi:hypothetical protein
MNTEILPVINPKNIKPDKTTVLPITRDKIRKPPSKVEVDRKAG